MFTVKFNVRIGSATPLGSPKRTRAVRRWGESTAACILLCYQDTPPQVASMTRRPYPGEAVPHTLLLLDLSTTTVRMIARLNDDGSIFASRHFTLTTGANLDKHARTCTFLSLRKGLRSCHLINCPLLAQNEPKSFPQRGPSSQLVLAIWPSTMEARHPL